MHYLHMKGCNTFSLHLSKVFGVTRRMTEMRQDVAETKDTIKDVLETEQLAGLCLTELQEKKVEPCDLPRSSESMKEAALLLQSYERQISTLENALKVGMPLPKTTITPHLSTMLFSCRIHRLFQD